MADADANKVEFELVSPERLLVSQTVDMVVVPGVEGDFGVCPFLSSQCAVAFMTPSGNTSLGQA